MQILILLFGTFACATSVFFIKESAEHPLLLASYRQLLAALALLPLYLRDRRRYGARHGRADQGRSFISGALLGLHFILWIVGARLARSANATLIVNLAPLAMPFFLHVLLKERLSGREWLATALALTGLVILAVSDFRIDLAHVLGDGLCFLSMLLFAWYLTLARRNRTMPSVWLYVVPLYAAGGVLCFLVALPFAPILKPYALREVACIAGLALVPTVLGHTALNHAMKHMRGQVVTVVNMGQFLYVALLAWVLYREVPQPAFYAAAGLVAAAGALVLFRRRAPVLPSDA